MWMKGQAGKKSYFFMKENQCLCGQGLNLKQFLV